MVSFSSNCFYRCVGLTCTVSKGSSKSNQKKKGSADAKDGKKEDKAAQDSSEASDEVLVLTNTGLTVGFHFWEIIASISCRNISKNLLMLN